MEACGGPPRPRTAILRREHAIFRVPGWAGSTNATRIRHLHPAMPPRHRGELRHLSTPPQKTMQTARAASDTVLRSSTLSPSFDARGCERPRSAKPRPPRRGKPPRIHHPMKLGLVENSHVALVSERGGTRRSVGHREFLRARAREARDFSSALAARSFCTFFRRFFRRFSRRLFCQSFSRSPCPLQIVRLPGVR